MKTVRIDAPNGAIAVHESAGEGPPVVLIHGNSSSSRVFPGSLMAGSANASGWSQSIFPAMASRTTRRIRAPTRFRATPARFGRSSTLSAFMRRGSSAGVWAAMWLWKWRRIFLKRAAC